MKKIRVFNDCDKEFQWLSEAELKEHFQEFIKTDYDGITNYMSLHQISKVHTALLVEWLEELDENKVVINLGNLEDVILDQVKTYWPKRLEDYQAKRIDVTIHVIQCNGDEIAYDTLKKKAGITAPDCNLIIGFNEATLFLGYFLVDPLDKDGY